MLHWPKSIKSPAADAVTCFVYHQPWAWGTCCHSLFFKKAGALLQPPSTLRELALYMVQNKVACLFTVHSHLCAQGWEMI